MSSTIIQHIPTSHLRLGVARADITPPVGIYHPMWGAARHHRATGVHRPLYGDVLVFAPLSGDGEAWAQVQLDMVGLGLQSHQQMRDAVAEALAIPPAHVVVSYSHTHSGGLFGLDRVNLPGGELIPGYLEEVRNKLREAALAAKSDLAECYLTYATGRCDMATNRDYWDAERGIYACGFNPDEPADDTVMVVRAAAPDGKIRATVVNYACHPTTLAWENTLISPDYVGALRETVEQVTNAPCVFTLGPCGELSPRRVYVKEPEIADANGRQVGYAALAALDGMDPVGQDYAYAGPVISGATLGTWRHTPQSAERTAETQLFVSSVVTIDLPQRPRPSLAELEENLQNFLTQQAEADRRGDALAARDLGARAERVRRAIGRLHNLPPGDTYPYTFTVRRFGDGYWVGIGGEPYNALQTEVRAAFPGVPIVFSVLAGENAISYMLKADRYGRGLYQEEPSVLAPGCLEQVTAAVIDAIRKLQ
jgi:hypothetical protein